MIRKELAIRKKELETCTKELKEFNKISAAIKNAIQEQAASGSTHPKPVAKQTSEEFLNGLTDGKASDKLKEIYLPHTPEEQRQWSNLSWLVPAFTVDQVNIQTRLMVKILTQNFATPTLYNLKQEQPEKYAQLLKNIELDDPFDPDSSAIQKNVAAFEKEIGL